MKTNQDTTTAGARTQNTHTQAQTIAIEQSRETARSIHRQAAQLAAAPELLEAANRALNFCCYITQMNAEPSLEETAEIRDLLRAAIAKAA